MGRVSACPRTSGVGWLLVPRESDGARLTSSDAGVLNGFPAGFPWSGSRSRQFLQAANVVAPQVAAALLAEVAG
ncbi:hypothetical protein [Arthrobacter sp. OY3WO11]|uniref:hypothetical protein n=1 Tax=Arthrobacter sp. OY3WO11 TaxID=1835723 RepID=UPI000AAFEE6A|nr:hypothetical protein [Arthrobacter sp. OY3WO11]